MTGTKAVVYLGCPATERSDTDSGLTAAGFSASWADTFADVLLRIQKVDAPILVDLSRGAAAIHSIRELRTTRPGTFTFAVTDPTRPDLTTEAILAGTADVFLRPLDGRRVARAIEREHAYAAALESGRRPEALPPGDLYGQSPSMREVLAQVSRAALERGGVLIGGEFGSGREMVARTLHFAQGSQGAFVTLDCADYNADSLERAIFGNRMMLSKDVARRPECVHHSGALYRANGGTLYLHNVAELPTRVQTRLVRALRDQEVKVTDTGDEVALDVRLIAAGDGDIDKAVQDGRLRDDLVRRLTDVRIDMPSLRQRREDIGPLANFFVREICGTFRVPPKTLSRPALSLIVALPWRRNAVELRAMLEAVVSGHAGGRGISLDDVLNHVSLGGGVTIAATDRTLRDARLQFEREYIIAVLERHRDRIGDAARTLGLQRTNLYRKMRTLKVDRSRRR